MKAVVATADRLLVSLSRDEVSALVNCASEVLHNSNLDERDCGSRIGIEHSELTTLLQQLAAALDEPLTPQTEIFDAWADGVSIQLRAISVFGDPADLSGDEVKTKILLLIERSKSA